MVATAGLSCFCSSHSCEVRGADRTAWAVLTGCGHVFHQGCIEDWFKRRRNTKCPVCSNDNLVYSHAESRKRRHAVQRLYLELDPNSLLSSQPDFASAPISDTDENDARPASDVSLQRVQSQLRETRNTLRDVKTERDALLALPARVALLERALDAVQSETDRAMHVRECLQHTVEDLEDQVAELKSGLPVRQLARARAELDECLTREAELEDELAEARAAKVEAENDAATNEIEWKAERQKLVAQIKTSGKAGATRIQDLKAEIDGLQAAKLQVQVKLDRFELQAQEEAAKVFEAHSKALKSAKDKAEAAIQSSRQSAHRVQSIIDENARLRQALASYENKEFRRKARQPQRTPEPEQAGLLSPRKALVGPYAMLSPRKPSVSPRVVHAAISSDDEPGPVVKMNGRSLARKRSAAQIADSDDDCVVDAPEEDDDILILSSDRVQAPPPSPPPPASAFATLVPPPVKRKLWTAKLAQLPGSTTQAKARPASSTSAVRTTGPKIRHRVSSR